MRVHMSKATVFWFWAPQIELFLGLNALFHFRKIDLHHSILYCVGIATPMVSGAAVTSIAHDMSGSFSE